MDEKTKEVMNTLFEHLTDEQKEKAKECNSADELLKIFGEWGVELPDDLSDIVTGGYQFLPYYSES